MLMLLKLEYSWGTLHDTDLQAYVASGILTKENYKKITGSDYTDNDQKPAPQPAANQNENTQATSPANN